MGTAVANMPPLGLNDSKKLHPFFTPGKVEHARKDDPSTPSTPHRSAEVSQIFQEACTTHNGAVEDAILEDDRSSKRRRIELPGGDGSAPSSNNRLPNLPGDIDTTPESSAQNAQQPTLQNTQHLSVVNCTPSEDALPKALPVETQVPVPPTTSQTPSGQEQISPAAPSPSERPKRLLRFNPKTGTIGSPPKPKPASKKAGGSLQQSTYVVTLRFGQDDEARKRIGQRINDILSSSPAKPVSKKRGRPSKADKAKAKSSSGGQQPALSLEPGSAKGSPATDAVAKPAKAQAAPKQTVFSSTPCSPKKPRAVFKSANFPQFGPKSMGLKVAGAAHPAWPAKGMAHVTGNDATSWALNASDRATGVVPRKSKGRPVAVTPAESVLDRFCDRLDLTNIRCSASQLASDDFRQPASELRLPEKHFESGLKLQKRIKSELRTPLPQQSTSSDSDDDVVIATRKAPHAAIARLYQSLPTGLSAFDQSNCEDVSWTQKYAPVKAEEVLQDGREAAMLRDWLEALKVQSVDTGISADAKAIAVKPASAAKKKKRKRGKLDDFVVSSDEDFNDLDNITDPEDEATTGGQSKQTIVQNDGVVPKGGKDSVRLSNIALLSGPHGSGKTATVHAIAKELGFEIFEINAGTRRSGKDILEKVGDMTRNHLVHGHQEDGLRSQLHKTTGIPDKGSAGTKKASVMSFFKPKTANKVQSDVPAVTAQEQPLSEPREEEKAANPRSQKQSLILLEEVDILFEEDKQFWATIATLIAQSKRPFVMTCNDESAVPFQTFNFYGIFRFSPPPKELAIDLLLLVAANEGHALRRQAVQTLLESKAGDLRASMTELNFWCQIGVGDCRGGFDWFYPRWPRGCDRDDNGDVVRVISEGTYLEGMGWLGRDVISESSLAVEEELMAQCWDSLQLDIGDWHRSRNMTAWASQHSSDDSKPKSLPSLEAYSDFAESMSAADLSATGWRGVGLQAALDCTQPAIPTKMRDDFVLGRKLLEAPLLVDYEQLSIKTMFAIQSKARDRSQTIQPSPGQLDSRCMKCTEESDAIRMIRSSFDPAANDETLTRMDMAYAFDAIAVSEQRSIGVASHLDPSVFDRTMRLITLDVAPFVRGIVAYDRLLSEGRMQRGTLLSEGARPGKRLRQTRAALSAGDGTSLRRESYFRARINPYLVMRTGGDWESAVSEFLRNCKEISPVADEYGRAGEAAPLAQEAALPAYDTTVGGHFVQIQPRPRQS